MTKKEALSYFGGSVTKCAEVLGISHSAISQWDNKSIPSARDIEIQLLAVQGKISRDTGIPEVL